jgi:hypothetical protein
MVHGSSFRGLRSSIGLHAVTFAIVMLLTIFSQHPIGVASATLPAAPPLPRIGTECKPVAPRDGVGSRAVAPRLVPTLTASPLRVVFHGLLLNSVLQGGAPSSVRSGYLYVKLDEQSPIYIASFPGGDPRGTQLYVGFPGARIGHHVLDFALVAPDSSALSFGRFCFDVKAGVELNYSLP